MEPVKLVPIDQVGEHVSVSRCSLPIPSRKSPSSWRASFLLRVLVLTTQHRRQVVHACQCRGNASCPTSSPSGPPSKGEDPKNGPRQGAQGQIQALLRRAQPCPGAAQTPRSAYPSCYDLSRGMSSSTSHLGLEFFRPVLGDT